MTPKQYICSIRLRRARQLLAESRMPIGAVAAECGFASLYHFSRAFHEASGISPSEYRARAGVWGGKPFFAVCFLYTTVFFRFILAFGMQMTAA